jgi:hypothetical protein
MEIHKHFFAIIFLIGVKIPKFCIFGRHREFFFHPILIHFFLFYWAENCWYDVSGFPLFLMNSEMISQRKGPTTVILPNFNFYIFHQILMQLIVKTFMGLANDCFRHITVSNTLLCPAVNTSLKQDILFTLAFNIYLYCAVLSIVLIITFSC